jgi:UDPglucose 6-dehydrogenase
MNIAMIGTGYVGLVTGACLAECGNDVSCIDVDKAKIERLSRGEIPIFEPGLEELVEQNVRAGRLKFSSSYAPAVSEARCVFLAVGTPQRADGSADLSYLHAAVDSLAPHLNRRSIVVIKSTVPVGTNRDVAARLKALCGFDVDVASNPEFLKEGCAIDDFREPDRVVVGTTRDEVFLTLHELYESLLRGGSPILNMRPESAELTKYVANCLLATKISFINEVANVCDRAGADIRDVQTGIGHDRRIGFEFLNPGVGYGGSCFPKDVREMAHTYRKLGVEPRILAAVDAVNDAQKHVLFSKLTARLGTNLRGKNVAVWGLAFKPKTDDIREAPSLVLVDSLLQAGATVKAHDPIAMNNAKRHFEKGGSADSDRLFFCEQQYDALEAADALVIVTDWSEFRNPNFALMRKRMRSPAIFDGRNLYDPAKMRAEGFDYTGVGRRG